MFTEEVEQYTDVSVYFFPVLGNILRSLKQDVERDGIISSVKRGDVLCSKSDNEFPT